MFGSNKRLERRLQERGVRAPADVLEATQSNVAVTIGNEAIVSNTEVVWKLRLRVKPAMGEPFEAEVKERYPQFGGPAAGQTVGVLFDPDDHSKVVIAHDQGSQLDAAINTALANSPGVAANPGLAGPIQDLMRAAISDPQGFQQRMRTQGPAAFGVDISEMMQMAQANFQAASPPPSQDPVDRLAKLADLHERGALTDEEFAEQKRKILGE